VTLRHAFVTALSALSSLRDLSILWPVYKRRETVTPEGEVTHRHRRFLAFADDLTPSRRSLSLFGFVVRETTN
jgi:hypothetical protein